MRNLLFSRKGEDGFLILSTAFSTLKSLALSFTRLYQMSSCLDDWHEQERERETESVQKNKKNRNPNNEKKAWYWRKGQGEPLPSHGWLQNLWLRERQWMPWQGAVLSMRTRTNWADSHWGRTRALDKQPQWENNPWRNDQEHKWRRRMIKGKNSVTKKNWWQHEDAAGAGGSEQF